MANCKSIRVSKKEAKFIKEACNLSTGIYDFENLSSSEFRKQYGIAKEDVNKMVATLEQKVNHALQSFKPV